MIRLRLQLVRTSVVLCAAITALSSALSAEVLVASPDGQVRFVVTLTEESVLRYTIRFRDRPVIEPSRLGLTLDHQALGHGVVVIGPVTRDTRNERYAIRGGHREAVDHSHGARIVLRHAASGTDFALEIRVFNDGAGFRWVIPSGDRSRVPDAGTDFCLPAHSTVWMHDLEPHYEGIFTPKRLPGPERGRNAPPPPAEIAHLPTAHAGEWTVVPLVAKLSGGAGYTCITESALADYAGLALQFGGQGLFRERLGHAHPPSYPYVLRYSLDEADRLARPAAIAGPIVTPWRVVMVAPDLDGLVNSDVITNLAPPPDPALFPEGPQPTWIKPGRALWKYLQPGDSTPEAMKEYARLARELGFEYNVLEGFWNRWTMEERRDVVQFSRGLGVGVWFWHHSRDLRTPETRREFFSMLAGLGVAGAKIDFLDHEAKETIDLYNAILAEAARYRVLVNFHGSNKPAGQGRTWPNEFTREAVHGYEHSSTQAWSAINTTLPFTRFLAGPADYTPVMFNERRHETSWAHQIATACVFTSPLLTYGARPQDLLANPAVELVKSLPTVWDRTIVLPESAIGELAAFARRSGDTWFVAVLNGPDGERTLEVPLSFLKNGGYDVLAFHDVSGDSGALRREERVVTAAETLTTSMRAGGGFIARLCPKHETTP